MRSVGNRSNGTVIYRAEKDHCGRFSGPASADLRGGPRRNFQVFAALDFLDARAVCVNRGRIICYCPEKFLVCIDTQDGKLLAGKGICVRYRSGNVGSLLGLPQARSVDQQQVDVSSIPDGAVVDRGHPGRHGIAANYRVGHLGLTQLTQ